MNWAAMASLLIGLVVTWLFLYGLVAPLQGPIARTLNGLDLSWLAGMLTAGLLYFALYKFGIGAQREKTHEELGEPAGEGRRTGA